MCKQIVIDNQKKIYWNIENTITIKHLQINKILTPNNPYGVDIPLNKQPLTII